MCVRFGPDGLRPSRHNDKPLHGVWLDVARELADRPLEREALRQRLAMNGVRFGMTLQFMTDAELLEGEQTIALTRRGEHRLRLALKRNGGRPQ